MFAHSRDGGIARSKVFRKGDGLPERKTTAADASSPHDEEARATARYLADMTAQLETMARAAKLELLAYLLAMARAEAQSLSLAAADTKSR